MDKKASKSKKEQKYKAGGSLKEIFHQSNLRELADYIIDPKNKVIKAVIVTTDRNEDVSINTTEGLKMTESVGMIEFAKHILLCDKEEEDA